MTWPSGKLSRGTKVAPAISTVATPPGGSSLLWPTHELSQSSERGRGSPLRSFGALLLIALASAVLGTGQKRCSSGRRYCR